MWSSCGAVGWKLKLFNSKYSEQLSINKKISPQCMSSETVKCRTQAQIVLVTCSYSTSSSSKNNYRSINNQIFFLLRMKSRILKIPPRACWCFKNNIYLQKEFKHFLNIKELFVFFHHNLSCNQKTYQGTFHLYI